MDRGKLNRDDIKQVPHKEALLLAERSHDVNIKQSVDSYIVALGEKGKFWIKKYGDKLCTSMQVPKYEKLILQLVAVKVPLEEQTFKIYYKER